jgi:hypothetical protein
MRDHFVGEKNIPTLGPGLDRAKGDVGAGKYATRSGVDTVDAFLRLNRGLDGMPRPDATGLSGGFADETRAAVHLCG